MRVVLDVDTFRGAMYRSLRDTFTLSISLSLSPPRSLSLSLSLSLSHTHTHNTHSTHTHAGGEWGRQDLENMFSY